MQPLRAAIYFSEKSTNREMPAPEILLKQFLDDVKEIQSSVIDCYGAKCSLADDGLIFCCDAPARSSLKKIILHSGYKSCEGCTVISVYDAKAQSVCLLKTNYKLRTDRDFS